MFGRKLVFVSCGQQTADEKSLGRLVKEEIETHPDLEAYLADSVQSLDSLRDNIFEALEKCSGAIIFLHNRGKALNLLNEEWGYRSSVWVNQEIAILAFRQYLKNREIPILVFKDDKVKMEGAMTAFIINPRPIMEDSHMLQIIRGWLNNAGFLPGLYEEFAEKWKVLSEQSRKVIYCLIRLGGRRVNENEIRDCLMSNLSISNNDASRMIQKARLQFQKTNLVQFGRNSEAIYEFSLHPTWDDYLRREMKSNSKI